MARDGARRAYRRRVARAHRKIARNPIVALNAWRTGEGGTRDEARARRDATKRDEVNGAVRKRKRKRKRKMRARWRW